MKPGQSLWTEEQLILALNLYCKIPFGSIHANNAKVIELAHLIQRTPGAVSYKLTNFASFDPALKARGIAGSTNASALDKQIWERFFGNLSELAFESELLLAQKQEREVNAVFDHDEMYLPEGKTTDRLVKQRVNQGFFREMILNFYNRKCCISGISQSDLLVAAHISPWSTDTGNRMNPSNGLCLNALHDKAYEAGLISITPEYTILVSSKLNDKKDVHWPEQYFHRYHKQSIRLPKHFAPQRELLEQHLEERFIR